MFIIQEKKSELGYIESHGLKFMTISELSDFDLSLVAKCDALILADIEEHQMRQLIAELRRATDKKIYLKPVFKLLDNGVADYLKFDGTTDLTLLDPMVLKTKEITERIEQVNTSVVPMNFEQQCIFKLLAFLFTRNEMLKPVPTRNSKIGYAFPFLDQLYRGESLEIIHVLKKTCDLGYTTQKLIDRVHNCSSCHSNYINFREVCPKCAGLSIESKDLVHHFKCAHVDIIDKFKIEDGLACPKCEQKMRHIGIDYDKPSSMYHCHDCHHEFQESEMSAYCIDCSNEEDTNNLLENEICSQALTEAGEQVVQMGWSLDAATEKSEGIEQILSLDLLKMMLKLEIQRSESKTRSSWAKLQFSEDILRPLGAEGQKIFRKEILEIVSSYVGKADLLTSQNAAIYHVLLSDRLKAEAGELMSLVEHNLLKLVADNIEHGEGILDITIKEITPDLKPNELS